MRGDTTKRLRSSTCKTTLIDDATGAKIIDLVDTHGISSTLVAKRFGFVPRTVRLFLKRWHDAHGSTRPKAKPRQKKKPRGRYGDFYPRPGDPPKVRMPKNL